MPEAEASPRSLDRNSDLMVASVYEREVASCLSGVWENVFDWEHLPWLHAQAFTSIDLVDQGDWGWCAEIGFPGGGRATVELVADLEAGRYVARTIEGAGAPGEIWTSLSSSGEAEDPEASTQIRVEFCIAPGLADAAEVIGKTYLAVYAELWDQDEEMMQTRAVRRIRPEASSATPTPVDLGLDSDLRKKLPMRFDFAGHEFRLIEQEGEFVAHSAECPHWGGPLSECAVAKGEITCPWHGYRFDAASGRSSDGRMLRLRSAPRVVLDAATGHWMAIS